MRTAWADSETSFEDDALVSLETALDDLDFSHERGEAEVHFAGRTSWTDVHGYFVWRNDTPTLTLVMSFDMRTPKSKRADMAVLVAQINESLWMGHFETWAEDGVIVWRHANPMPGKDAPSLADASVALAAAVDALDRFYPAFNFLIWADKTPEEAIASSLFETAGEA
jgi:hypothetical protein